jgi:hypothetical protein
MVWECYSCDSPFNGPEQLIEKVPIPFPDRAALPGRLSPVVPQSDVLSVGLFGK